jgi:outer membrane protein assembly factor BamE (lipoprotein component of BamABCDE complex)
MSAPIKTRMTRKRVLCGRLAPLLAACLALAGCASPMDELDSRNALPEFSTPGMSMQGAKDAIVAGKSTKADVAAVLGTGTIVKFDSGYEAWVYRAKAYKPAVNAPGTNELVVLFTPAGIVKKTRIRTP